MTVERMRRRVELEERLGLSDDGKLLRYSQQIGGPDGKTNHYEVASRYLKEILRSTVASPPQRFSIAVGKSACRYQSDGRIDSLRLARRSAAVRQSYAMYALDAKAAIFRSERRLLPALATILIPTSVLSKKSAMVFALVSTCRKSLQLLVCLRDEPAILQSSLLQTQPSHLSRPNP